MPLCHFVAVAVLAVVLAYWTWLLIAPAPVARAAPVATTEGRLDGAFRLFGDVQATGTGAVQVASSVRLLGVVAASAGHPAYAVVRMESNEVLAVRIGKELAPGLRLAEVHADHIVLERGGVRQSVGWPDRNMGATGAAPAEPR